METVKTKNKLGRPPIHEKALSNSEKQKRYLANPVNLAKHKERQKRYRQKLYNASKYIKENNIVLTY